MGRQATLNSSKKPTVQVSKSSKDRFVEWLRKNRSPHQGETVGAILDWFIEQDEVVRAVVLGMYPKSMTAKFAEALDAMAAKLRGELYIDPDELESKATPRQQPGSGVRSKPQESRPQAQR